MNSYFRLLFTAIAAMAVCTVLMFMIHTHGKVLLAEYLVYYLWFIPPVLMIEIIRHRSKLETEGIAGVSKSTIISGVILFLFLLLVLVSSLNHHKWFYFLKWRHAPVPGFHYFHAEFIEFLLLTQFLILFFLLFKKHASTFIALVLLCIQIFCLGMFLTATKGSPLYIDDHTCFIYRLWEFGKTFPQFMNYCPYWNCGVEDCSIVTTGAVSLGLLFLPVWKFACVVSSYTYVYGVLFIVMIPLLYIFSVRAIGGNWISAWCAGILAIGVSQHYFLWLFHYGTPGALLSSAFLAPFASCIYRVVWLDKREWRLAVMLVLTGFFLVLWPPGVIMGAGVLFSLLFSLGKWTRKKIVFLFLCFIAFLVLYFKILAVIASPAMFKDILHSFNSEIRQSAPSVSRFNYADLIEGWRQLCAHVKEGHPLLIVFGIGGIFLLSGRGIALWYLPILLFMMFFAGWGEQISSELQLTRMAIPMFFVSIIPASLWIGRLIDVKNIRLILLQAALTALLIMGGWNCAGMYNNKGLALYYTISPEVSQLVDWIRKNVPSNGRVLFAGPTLHAYGRGHVVVLPYLTGREMIAADYVQFSASEMASYFPPTRLHKDKEALFKYMELYNITDIVAWEDCWKDIFRAYPDQYIEETTFEGITIFKVERAPEIFIQGSGSIGADFNVLRIHINESNRDAVIKYNWIDGISVSKPAEIFPFDAGGGVKFIGIRPNGQRDVVIRYKSWR